MSKNLTLKIVLSGLFIALALLLPFLTGQIPQIGTMLCPMHIPVLICGFILGWKYGLIVGLVSPLLRSLIFIMPALYPQAIAMSFELGAYGFFAGILYQIFKKQNIFYIYIILILSMILGRIVYGLVFYLISIFDYNITFNFNNFFSIIFISAWPGIILHLLLIPIVVKTIFKYKKDF